jgi:hypothetical protein
MIVSLVDKVMAWEDGGMDESQTIEFFQELIDTGMAWQLQGCYGRTASRLINQGLCHAAGKEATND